MCIRDRCLNSDSLVGQESAANMLSKFETLPQATKQALLAKTKYNEKENWSDKVISTKHVIKRAAIATLKKIDPDYLKPDPTPF